MFSNSSSSSEESYLDELGERKRRKKKIGRIDLEDIPPIHIIWDDDIRKENYNLTKWFYLFILIRQMVFGIIICLNENLKIITLLLTIFYVISLLIFILVRPYNSTFRNVVYIL